MKETVLAMWIVRPLLIATAIFSFCDGIPDSRGVRPSPAAEQPAIETFEPDQSAAVFVGVRRFPYDKTLTEVPYAVDDAVDLACVLALDERVRLVDPSRVILALSGEPQKPESRRNLERLVAAGAQIRPAGGPDILTVLDEQSRVVGKRGVLIFAFATHGFTEAGTQYLLTATSILRHHEGVISESEICDIASQSDAARSLILVDACRERLTADRRSSRPDARSAAPLLRAMEGVHGQVVLSAAAAGQYAYDDDARRNGVFTAAVIDGLHCQASADDRGLITVDSLSSFVENRVLTWIRKYRNRGVTHATQVSCEGSAKAMPLAECRRVASSGAKPAIAVSHENRTETSTAVSTELTTSPPQFAESSAADPTRSIAVVVFADAGEPVPQLAAAANDAIREAGYRPISLPRSTTWSPGDLKQLAAGRVESLHGMHLSKDCRAVFVGNVARSTARESDASLQGMMATHLHLRFHLFDSDSGAVLSSFESEAKGGGFSKETAEMQAWERAAAILRIEMRKMRWTELLAAR